MPARAYEIELHGPMLDRGFWLYVWDATTPSDDHLLYVGRTGDSSSANAQSPINRMGQHLGYAKNSNMLRKHLEGLEAPVNPNACHFRLVSYGPILEEASDMTTHRERRDVVGAMEKRLADDLNDAGYHVLNPVNSLKPLNEPLYREVRMTFKMHFPFLGASSAGEMR